jgi:hypothetical protein
LATLICISVSMLVPAPVESIRTNEGTNVFVGCKRTRLDALGRHVESKALI